LTLDNLPDYVTAADLEPYGITPEDVRQLCPLAIEYGHPSAPYWHRDDLAPLLDLGEREDAP
jgi:hypothetical protein